MAGPGGGDYRVVRIGIAIALVGLVVLIVALDSVGVGRSVDPVVLFSLLLTAAGMVAVDVKLTR